MDAGIELGLIGVGVGVVGILAAAGFSWWAINDARKQVREQTRIQRNLAWVKIQTDLMWLFINPTEKAHSKEIAKGLEEFALLSRALDPRKKPENLKAAAENEALETAEKLVRDGLATWKEDFDVEKVRQALHTWKAEKDAVRAAKDSKRKTLRFWR